MPNIRVILAAIILSLVNVGCIYDDEPAPAPEGPEYTAGFYVTVEDGNSTSRAGEYDEGSGFENYIDLSGSDVRVVLYDTSNKYISTLSELTITKVAEYSSGNRYYISGTTTSDISSGVFKIMFLANWGKYPDLTDIEKVWAQQYTFSNTWKLSPSYLIPLYGIKDIEITGGIQANVAANLGEIKLIRAMAKIEVNLNVADGFTLEKLQLTHYNTRGYCTPDKADSEDDYYHGSWDKDYTAYVNIPTGTTAETGLDFVKVSDSKWILYVPEYSNTTSGIEKAQIAISFQESFFKQTDYLDFLHPTTSAVMDIYRNYWYRFNITKKPENSELDVIVDVIPYTAVELEPGFGILK